LLGVAASSSVACGCEAFGGDRSAELRVVDDVADDIGESPDASRGAPVSLGHFAQDDPDPKGVLRRVRSSLGSQNEVGDLSDETCPSFVVERSL
jgi:hypothetical protein